VNFGKGNDGTDREAWFAPLEGFTCVAAAPNPVRGSPRFDYKWPSLFAAFIICGSENRGNPQTAKEFHGIRAKFRLMSFLIFEGLIIT